MEIYTISVPGAMSQNFRSILSLFKILTGIIANSMYICLKKNSSAEQKVNDKNLRGVKDHLYYSVL